MWKRERLWDVLFIGGASGTGKTSVSYPLAHRFGVGLTEIDDLILAVRCLTTPEQQPTLHFWHTHPEAFDFTPKQILELHLSVSRALSPALVAVAADHLESGTAIIYEGDYLLPEHVAQIQQANPAHVARLRSVFLYEPDEAQLIRNYQAREPGQEPQSKRARVSWLFGQWLQAECSRLGLAALAARPWDTLTERLLAAIA